MTKVADAIRQVTATVLKDLSEGRRSPEIDAGDVVMLLLAIADHLDPPFGDPASEDEPHEE
jgi:hypothetical protein